MNSGPETIKPSSLLSRTVPRSPLKWLDTEETEGLAQERGAYLGRKHVGRSLEKELVTDVEGLGEIWGVLRRSGGSHANF